MNTIQNRNEVVVSTFDEFAEKVEDMDFSVEDIVAYVTTLCKTFYWLNVESVWGQIGFIWDSQDSEKKGYGHFVKTTIPFTIIPKLPDGERITELRGDFIRNITEPEIVVQRSNWENLTVLNDIVNNGCHLTIDLTGNNITTIKGLLQNNGGTGNVYIKGDFSKATGYIGGASTYFGQDFNDSRIEIDDNNRYLNFPCGDGITRLSIYYFGNDWFNLNYFFRDNDVNANIRLAKECIIHSVNGKYNIKANDSMLTGDLKIARVSEYNYYPKEDTVFEEINFDVTNCTVKDIDLNAIIYNITSAHFIKYLKIIGDYNTCNFLNPFYNLDKDNDWTEDEQTNKILNTGCKTSTFYFYQGVHAKVHRKCPYKIDLSKYLNFYEYNKCCCIKNEDVDYTNFNYTLFNNDKNVAVNFAPEYYDSDFDNEPTCEEDFTFKTFSHWYDFINFQFCNTNGKSFYYAYPLNNKIKVKTINNDVQGSFIQDNCYLKLMNSTVMNNLSFNTPTVPKFKFYFFADSPGQTYNNDSDSRMNLINYLPANTEYINLIEFNTYDRDVIATAVGTHRFEPLSRYATKIHNPCLFANKNFNGGFFWSGNGTNSLRVFDEETPFIMIYNNNMYFNKYAASELEFVMNAFRTYILPNIYPLETAGNASITFNTLQYNELTDEEKDYIINVLGYLIIESS